MQSLLILNIASYLIMCNAKFGPTNQQLITAALMADYDRINRPAINMSQPIEIRLNPQIFSIIEVNVADQTLTLKQWLNMYWTDPNLTWDPAAYGGVTTIMLQRSTIWLPDIVIVQQTDVSTVADDLSLAKVRSDGYVNIAMDELVTLTCQFDVSDFPYDTQNCSVRYSSWMYAADELDPYPQDVPDTSVYIENGEWTLRSYTARKLTSMSEGQVFIDVYFDIKITRKPSYYLTTFVWPSFLITCLSIVGVFSPFNDAGEREEKVTMGLTTLLTMAVILMIITDQMPKSSNGVPLLGLFIMLEIIVASIATILSVIVVYLHRNWMNEAPVPNWLLHLTLMAEKKRKKSAASSVTQAWPEKEDTERESKADRKLLVAINKGIETVNLNINVSDFRNESLREQWSKATHRLDFILMIIFLIVNTIICAYIVLIGNSMLND